jgi:lipopolysaccharide/colanic/teichoic acid biosynthesis glycosyltransferase
MKRAFDLVTSSALLALLSPLMAAVALLVRLRLGRPVLFRQIRPGLAGKPFELVKFRTMRAPGGRYQTDAERLTPLGRFLRASSLDELPELWNVLKGDMSLVGPRPLLMEYIPLYTPRQGRRHEVRPGLTGWAQVNGRNELSWAAKFELDVWYVENRTFGLDLLILWRTVIAVLKREGIGEESGAAQARFNGSEEA